MGLPLIDAPSFDAVLSDFTGFIGDLPLVGHETEFLAHDYTIMEQGNEIAPVHKVWLSWGDSFELNIYDTHDEIGLIAVILAIDAVMDSNRSSYT